MLPRSLQPRVDRFLQHRLRKDLEAFQNWLFLGALKRSLSHQHVDSEALRFGDLDFDVLVTLATARAEFEPVANLPDEFFGRLFASRCNHLD